MEELSPEEFEKIIKKLSPEMVDTLIEACDGDKAIHAYWTSLGAPWRECKAPVDSKIIDSTLRADKIVIRRLTYHALVYRGDGHWRVSDRGRSFVEYLNRKSQVKK